MSLTHFLNSFRKKSIRTSAQNVFKPLKTRIFHVFFKVLLLPFYLLGFLLCGTGFLKKGANNPLEGNTEVVGGVSLLLIGFGMNYFYKRATRSPSLENQQIPNTAQNFYWKKGWTEGRIPDMTCRAATILGICALSWNILAWGTYFWVTTEEFPYISRLSSIASILPISAVALAGLAFYYYWRFRTYSTTYLTPATLPIYIGENFFGYIQTPKPLTTQQDIVLKLRCIKAKHYATGAYRTTREHLLWEGRQILSGVALQESAHPDRIPVNITIPGFCEPTYGANARETVVWRLVAQAKNPGKVGYYASFEIPVYKPTL